MMAESSFSQTKFVSPCPDFNLQLHKRETEHIDSAQPSRYGSTKNLVLSPMRTSKKENIVSKWKDFIQV